MPNAPKQKSCDAHVCKRMCCNTGARQTPEHLRKHAPTQCAESAQHERNICFATQDHPKHKSSASKNRCDDTCKVDQQRSFVCLKIKHESVFFFDGEPLRDQASRHVQTEMRKNCKKKKAPSFRRPDKRPETKAREEQEDARRGRRTEPARLYTQQTQAKHDRNQAVLPMRLGVDSRESGQSRTQSLARHRAKLASTPEGTRASSESCEPVPCGKRCRRCSMRHTLSAGVQVANSSPTRSSLTPRCGVLRPPLHAQPEPYAEVARCVARLAPAQNSGKSRWNGAGSGYLAECSLMQIQAAAAR